MDKQYKYFKEYWTGDSRDGRLVNGDGYHYYKMDDDGLVIDAFEVYELDDGTEMACHLPEMLNINWFSDLGFDDTEALDSITPQEFTRISNIAKSA